MAWPLTTDVLGWKRLSCAYLRYRSVRIALRPIAGLSSDNPPEPKARRRCSSSNGIRRPLVALPDTPQLVLDPLSADSPQVQRRYRRAAGKLADYAIRIKKVG
jgi:hypothetical protein